MQLYKKHKENKKFQDKIRKDKSTLPVSEKEKTIIIYETSSTLSVIKTIIRFIISMFIFLVIGCGLSLGIVYIFKFL